MGKLAALLAWSHRAFHRPCCTRAANASHRAGFIFAGPAGARVGKSSTFELMREQLMDDLSAGEITTDEFQGGFSALLSGRVPEVGTLALIAPPSAPTSPALAVVDSTVVSGNARYVLKGGSTATGPYRPIVGALVQFVDRTWFGDVSIGSPVQTDANGHYSAVVPGIRPDWTSVNLVVEVLSSSTAARIGPSGQRLSVWGAEGGPIVINSAATTVNVIAGPESQINRVFSILDVITVAFNFLLTFNAQTEVGANPTANPLQFIEFPGAGANGSFFSQTPDAHLNVGANHTFDWDVLQHEYGHYVQFLNGTSVDVGGEHFIGGNNTGNNCLSWKAGGCAVPRPAPLTKDEGDRLAWGEGWPTFHLAGSHDERHYRHDGGIYALGCGLGSHHQRPQACEVNR